MMTVNCSPLLCVVIFLVKLTSGFLYPRDVSIAQVGEDGSCIVEEGTDLNLTCNLLTTTRSAADIRWYGMHGYSSTVELDTDLYTVNGNTSTLFQTNITGIGVRRYFCGFDSNIWNWRKVAVAICFVRIVPKPPIVQCFSRTQTSFWCEYTEQASTGLKSTFTMEHSDYFGGEPYHHVRWIPCIPQDESENKCYVSGYMLEQYIRVNHTNLLGTGSRYITFNPIYDAVPGPVTHLRIDRATSRTLTLSWKKPTEWRYSITYQITYKECGNLTSTHHIVIERSSSIANNLTLKRLFPHRNYCIEIKSQNYFKGNTKWGENAFVIGTTLQEAPTSTVQNLTYINITADNNAYKRDVTIQWQEVPEDSRLGDIVGYNIYLTCNEDETVRVYHVDDLSYRISDVDKFQTYNLSVAAKTIAGEGPKNTISLEDLTTDPIQPEMEYGFPIARSRSSIEVRWKKPENPKGYIEHYLLQWSNNQVDWVPKDPGLQLSASQYNYTITDLHEGTKYYFRLGVKNKIGVSEMNIQINRSVQTFIKKKHHEGLTCLKTDAVIGGAVAVGSGVFTIVVLLALIIRAKFCNKKKTFKQQTDFQVKHGGYADVYYTKSDDKKGPSENQNTDSNIPIELQNENNPESSTTCLIPEIKIAE